MTSDDTRVEEQDLREACLAYAIQFLERDIGPVSTPQHLLETATAFYKWIEKGDLL